MNHQKPLLWVDGYNVIFADSYLKELAQKDILAAVGLLIEKVAEYAAFQGRQASIFFDRRDLAGPLQEEEYLGVRVLYGNQQVSADTLMERMSGGLGSKPDIVLVTSDNLLKQILGGRLPLARQMTALELLKELKNLPRQAADRGTHPAKLADALSGVAREYFRQKRYGERVML